MKKIDNFRGKYFFLSNFFECPISYGGITFRNTECAFQAQKSLSDSIKQKFSNCDPSRGKSIGRHIALRKDWELVKDNIMYEVVKAKFEQNEDLKQKLIETEDAILIEGNMWGDDYWGVCTSRGKNNLGKILMKIRDELK